MRGTRKTLQIAEFLPPWIVELWEIVEFPVDGESRTERSLEIFKSGLHGGKNPTECVPIHLGVSREYIGKSHNREPRPVFHSLTDALLTTRL
jgi:hypothetical protein